MARTITLTWDLPTVRADGSAMPKAEIDSTKVDLSSDGGKTYSPLATIKGDATQTVTQDVPDGAYTLRFTVTNIYGRSGLPVTANAVVSTPAPGSVTNIKVTVSG